jgi:hypothetical protein
VARQKKLLRELGVPDWSPEEFGPSAMSSPLKARMRRRRFGRMCRSASGSRRSRPDSSPRLVTSRARREERPARGQALSHNDAS